VATCPKGVCFSEGQVCPPEVHFLTGSDAFYFGAFFPPKKTSHSTAANANNILGRKINAVLSILSYRQLLIH